MKYKLSTKLFIHLALTILMALSISSYMQYRTFKTEYLYNLQNDSLHDLEMIQKNIHNYKESLKKIALNFSTETSVLNTLNLISNYQDSEHYDAVLFDEEKKSLLLELTAKINNFEDYSFGIFDKYNNPVVLNQVLNGKLNSGYFTYTNSGLSFYSIVENRLDALPVLMKIDETQGTSIHTVVEDDAISLIITQKIYLQNELIGYLRVKKRFTQDNIAVLTHELRSQFSFVVNDLVLGNIAILNHDILEEYIKTYDKKEPQSYFNDENYYYYIHTTTSFNQSDIYYVVASPKELLDHKISNLLWQLCFAFIFALLVAFIISFVFLHYNIIKPLRLLMNGIKLLNQKTFQPIRLNSSDELEEIAQEFNTISYELKESFNRIEQDKLFLENLVDSIPARIFWKDLEGNYLGANNLMLQDAGMKTKEELLGKTDYELTWTKEEADAFRADDFEVISKGEAKRLIEEPQTRPDGSKVVLLTSKVPLKDSNGNVIGLLGVYQDITNLKHLEREIKNKEMMLLHQSKMAAMGEMLENIAHQWRQPLSIITTIASGLKLNKELGLLNDTMLVESLDQIMTSGKFLSQTVDDFRDFYKQDVEKHSYNIAHVLEKTLSLLSSKLHNRNIAMVLNLQEVEVEGFENEMVQAFLNIFNNSIDAFEEALVEHKAIFVDFELIENGLQIKIYDNAGGIPTAILPKIFEAKFTTKPHSKGTGIGLYMTKLILEKIEATIEVQNTEVNYLSQSHQGALFIIKIPRQ